MTLIELTIIRTVLAFVALLLVTKMMGRKQLSQMTFFDYVVGITIGSTASTMSVELDNETLVPLTGIIVWASMAVLMGWLVLKSVTVQRLVQGVPVPIVERGRLQEQSMRDELLTVQDLTMQLREQQVFSLQDVEAVFLEANGRMSVKLKDDRTPPTARQLGKSKPSTPPPRLVIEDGLVNLKALQQSGHDLEWLHKQLKRHGVNDPSQVIAAQVHDDGSLWLDRRA